MGAATLLSRSACHSAARAYAARLGWYVFPVGADCRSPLIEGGCHSAVNDPAAIDRIWSERPGANLALACGPKSGVWALDIDRHGDQDGFLSLMAMEDEFGPLPLTWTQATPNNGEHRLFRSPAGRELRNRQKLYTTRDGDHREYFPGLDVRSAGGSICLAPSAKEVGPYRWLQHPTLTPLADAPAWLLEIVDPPLPPPKPMPPIRGRSPDRVARYIEAAIDAEAGELARTAANTGRNQRLFIAAANLGSLVGAGFLPQDVAEAVLERAAADCGLVKDDGLHSVRATITSGVRRGLQNPREVRFD